MDDTCRTLEIVEQLFWIERLVEPGNRVAGGE
jgi:hypothetical protein